MEEQKQNLYTTFLSFLLFAGFNKRLVEFSQPLGCYNPFATKAQDAWIEIIDHRSEHHSLTKEAHCLHVSDEVSGNSFAT